MNPILFSERLSVPVNMGEAAIYLSFYKTDILVLVRKLEKHYLDERSIYWVQNA